MAIGFRKVNLSMRKTLKCRLHLFATLSIAPSVLFFFFLFFVTLDYLPFTQKIKKKKHSSEKFLCVSNSFEVGHNRDESLLENSPPKLASLLLGKKKKPKKGKSVNFRYSKNLSSFIKMRKKREYFADIPCISWRRDVKHRLSGSTVSYTVEAPFYLRIKLHRRFAFFLPFFAWTLRWCIIRFAGFPLHALLVARRRSRL